MLSPFAQRSRGDLSAHRRVQASAHSSNQHARRYLRRLRGFHRCGRAVGKRDRRCGFLLQRPVCDQAARRLFRRSVRRNRNVRSASRTRCECAISCFPLWPRSGFGDGGRVDETDQPALSCLGRLIGQGLANKQREPIAALSHAIKQRNVGNIDQPDSARPSRRAPQTSDHPGNKPRSCAGDRRRFRLREREGMPSSPARSTRGSPSRRADRRCCFQSQLASNS